MREMCKERFRPIVEEIEKLLGTKEQTILIAIDGMSASGKTTLGYYLQELFSGNLFHMDDFFLRENQRTPERLAEVGGNIDYERFKREVIIPVLEIFWRYLFSESIYADIRGNAD